MNASFYKGFLSCALLACFAAAILFTSGNAAEAQRKKKKSKWNKSEAGAIPSEWGDLVAFTGQKGGLFLMFKDDSGTLRYAEVTGGGKLGTRVVEIKREY